MRPGAKALLIVAPGKAFEFAPQRPGREIGMSIEKRRCEVAPAELGHELLGVALHGRPAGGGALDGGGDAAG
jgi:hypothetical protein